MWTPQAILRLALHHNSFMFLIAINPRILESTSLQKIYHIYLPFIILILYIKNTRLILRIILAIQLQLQGREWTTFLRTLETSLKSTLSNRAPIYSGIEQIADVVMILQFPLPIVLLLTMCHLEEILKWCILNSTASISPMKTCWREADPLWWNQLFTSTITSRHNTADIRLLKISSNVSIIHTALEVRPMNIDCPTPMWCSRVSALKVQPSR